MDDKLVRRCLGLPNEEKERLIRLMQETMTVEREDDGSRLHTLYKAATNVVGGGILSDSTLRKAVIGRKMIAYKMREEGYSHKSIAEALKRSRTSARHLCNLMADALALPHIYKYEVECWNKFNELL